jgi:hypothetical protein
MAYDDVEDEDEDEGRDNRCICCKDRELVDRPGAGIVRNGVTKIVHAGLKKLCTFSNAILVTRILLRLF